MKIMGWNVQSKHPQWSSNWHLGIELNYTEVHSAEPPRRRIQINRSVRVYRGHRSDGWVFWRKV